MNPIIDYNTHQCISSENSNRSICLDNFYKRLPAAEIFMVNIFYTEPHTKWTSKWLWRHVTSHAYKFKKGPVT